MAVITVVAVTMCVLFYYRYSSSRPIITVDGVTITRKQYLDALEFQDKGNTIKKLVFETLVMQAAKREGALPSDDDVQRRIAEIRRRSPQLIPDPNSDKVHYDQFIQDLTMDIALENLRIKGLTASEDEIAAFYKSHPTAFVLPTQVDSTMVFTQTDVDAATAAADLRQGLSEDSIARQPRLHVVGVGGFNVNLNALPDQQRISVTRAMLATQPGDVKTVKISDGAYLTFKIKKADRTTIPPLSQVHDLAARDVKLEKAPNAAVEIAVLYQKYKPVFDNPKYQSTFSDVERANVADVAQAR